MSDRLKGVTVVFDADYRDDDAEAIVAAILMIKGVARVAPTLTVGDDYMARARVEADIHSKLHRAIDRAFKVSE